MRQNKRNRKTTDKDMEYILNLIDRNGFSLEIEDNPSREKIERIKQAIRRKEQLLKEALSEPQLDN